MCGGRRRFVDFSTRRNLRDVVLKLTRNFSGKTVENARTQQALARVVVGKEQ